MARSILIGLDGSPCSAATVELALRWARRYDITLVGLGVIDEPAICAPEPLPIGGTEYKDRSDAARIDRARREVEKYLESFALRCDEAGVAHRILEEVGEPFERIRVEAQRCDLVLLGQETHFHFMTQQSPDSGRAALLRQIPRPLVLVPPKLNTGTAVVVAYDGSLQAARTLHAFVASKLIETEPVQIVTVHKDRAEAERFASRAVEYLAFHSIKAIADLWYPIMPVADIILSRARDLNAGLVVMGAHSKPAIHEFLLGSVTRSVLRDTTVPLFLYH